MISIGDYALQIATPLTFEEAIHAATECLKAEGFGILTEIDVQETFKKKLGIEHKPFLILGACNPTFAHRAIEAVPQVSVLLPCNVVVWDEGDHRVVAAMEPNVIAQVIKNPDLVSVAGEVSARLHRVLHAIDHFGADA